MRSCLVLLIVVIVAIIIVYRLGVDAEQTRFGGSSQVDTNNRPEGYTLEYLVTGSVGSADIRYENETRGTTSREEVSLPFRFEMPYELEQYAMVRAENYEKRGVLKCQILINGVMQTESTDQGENLSVWCSGRWR